MCHANAVRRRESTAFAPLSADRALFHMQQSSTLADPRQSYHASAPRAQHLSFLAAPRTACYVSTQRTRSPLASPHRVDLQEQLQETLATEYRLERELGGGTERVFVVRERTLDCRVVVKMLMPDFSETISVDRFRREIRLAAPLQQANIVPVYAVREVEALL